jgi:hypothetical protein
MKVLVTVLVVTAILILVWGILFVAGSRGEKK